MGHAIVIAAHAAFRARPPRRSPFSSSIPCHPPRVGGCTGQRLAGHCLQCAAVARGGGPAGAGHAARLGLCAGVCGHRGGRQCRLAERAGLALDAQARHHRDAAHGRFRRLFHAGLRHCHRRKHAGQRHADRCERGRRSAELAHAGHGAGAHGPAAAVAVPPPGAPMPAFRHMAHNGMLLVGSVVVIVVCLLLVFQDFASTMRNHTKLRYLINPLNSVYALGNIATKPLRLDTSTLMPLGRDAQLGASYAGQQKPPLLVLVLGETGRSVNFGLNGYERPTTPCCRPAPTWPSARNAWSCGTSTAASVPCMFSHLGRDGFESRKANYESLIDVLHHAGLAVLWVDNQAGCKGVCERIGEVRTTALKDPVLCPGGECLDPIMLKDLDQRLADLPAEQRQPRHRGGAAPDGQPRPRLLQALGPGPEEVPARMHLYQPAGMHASRW
jgi:hypothetical protein